MNKKIKNLFLAGALVLGFAGVAVSCTDYDDDINNLQNQKADKTELSALQQTVSGLQTSINAGYVITGVSKLSGEPGGWRFTTSDGKNYDVTNGTNGEDGKPGAPGKDGKPGDYYTPNAETGTWFLHSVDAEGNPTVTDTKQSILPEGFIKVELDPETNKVIIKAGDKEFPIELNGSSASFVFIPQVQVDGVNGMEITSIEARKQVLDLKAKADDKTEKWIDADLLKDDKGKNAWDVLAKEIADNKIKFETEAAQEDYENNWMMDHGYLITNNLGAVAQYHVNSDIVFDENAEYSFTWKDNEVVTRVKSSSDFAMNAEFVSCEDGILTVAVGYVGRPAGVDEVSNHMTLFALQVTKDGKTYTSDYATFINTTVANLRIADPKDVVKECKKSVPNSDEHYRRGEIGIANKDAEDLYRPDVAVWTPDQTTNDDAGMAKARATCDTVVAYDSSIDLADITAVHFYGVGNACPKPSGCINCGPNDYPAGQVLTAVACREMAPADMDKFGLHFEYEIVKNYKIGDPKTDQADFVTLDGSVFTPRVFETSGIAAVGRTPIVRVKLMLGDEIVKVAYIKIFIAETEDIRPTIDMVPRRDGKDDGENIFKFSCDGDSLLTTVHDMNVYLYNDLNRSKKEFHITYDSLGLAPQKDTIGTVEDVLVGDVEGTHVIKWKISAQDLWKISGKDEISIVARYYHGGKGAANADLYVDIKLTASVADAIKAVELSSAKGDYLKNYWTENYAATKYNVNTPSQGETDPTKCVFGSDINASFVTYDRGTADEGKLKVPTVDSVYYFFCSKDIPKITSIGNLAVKFRVGVKGDSLFASILDAKGTPVKVKDANGNEVTEDLVAYIDNKPTTVGVTDPYTVWNTFYWVKGAVVADSLLNTGEMYTFIGAKAFQCTEELGKDARELDVTFDGADHFRANVIRPLDVANKAADGFVDAVNFGTKGSYIKIEDLLDPVDWRQLKFSANEFFWDYYGPFEITVDVKNAEWNGTSDGSWAKVPRTIVLTQTAKNVTAIVDPIDGTSVTLKTIKDKKEVDMTTPEDINGYLTYKNNRTNVTDDFKIRVKAKISYGFGWLDTNWIEIDVAKTIGQ